MTTGVPVNGDRVRSLRLAQHLTQGELATAAGISVALLYRIENREGISIRPKNLRSLAKAFGVPMDDLLAHVSPHAGLTPVRMPLRILAAQLLGTDDEELTEVASLVALATLSNEDARLLADFIRTKSNTEIQDLIHDAIHGKLLKTIRPAVGTRRAATPVVPPENESQFLAKHGKKGKVQ